MVYFLRTRASLMIQWNRLSQNPAAARHRLPGANCTCKNGMKLATITLKMLTKIYSLNCLRRYVVALEWIFIPFLSRFEAADLRIYDKNREAKLLVSECKNFWPQKFWKIWVFLPKIHFFLKFWRFLRNFLFKKN